MGKSTTAKNPIVRIRPDGSIVTNTKEKKSDDELRIVYNREKATIEITARKDATDAQLETAVKKVREILDGRRSMAGDSKERPEIKASDYKTVIELPDCALTKYQVDTLGILLVSGMAGKSFDKVVPKYKPKKKPEAAPTTTADDSSAASDTTDTASDSGTADTTSATATADTADAPSDTTSTADDASTTTSDATSSTDDADTSTSDDAADTRSASDDSDSEDSSDDSSDDDSSEDSDSEGESHEHPGHDDCHDPGDWYWNTPIDAKAIAAEFDKIG